MEFLKGNAVVGQSGGPTAAINATLAGVLEGFRDAAGGDDKFSVFGMRNGIEGFMRDELIDLTPLAREDARLRDLAATPAAALGSCRKKLPEPERDGSMYEAIFDVIKRHGIRYFFYIGGNDSMDTVMKLSDYSKKVGYQLNVIGIPKTIDNDLEATDHTPGFGSAAKYVATVVKEIIRDTAVYTTKAVTVIEIMGRDAGWLTAASSLTRLSGGDMADMTYLPERVFDPEKFIAKVRERLEVHPNVVVCVSEGVRLPDGRYVGASGGASDVFGHTQLSGAGAVISHMVKKEIGCKTRSVELSLTQRCAGHMLSGTDIAEAVEIGRAAVFEALRGGSGRMMVFVRNPGEYSVSIESRDIHNIANAVKHVPDGFINDDGDGVTDECLEYLAPLIIGEMLPVYDCGLPRHVLL